MREVIRDWLVGITCAAMVVALAESLTPQGTIRKIGRFTGGLVLLLAVVQPVMKLDEGSLRQSMAEYKAALSIYDGTLEEENQTLMKGIIAEQSGAYILDKAASLGIVCTVEVETAPGEEGDYPVPYCVTIRGDLTGEQQKTLTEQIAADFAIPEERQYYESGESG